MAAVAAVSLVLASCSSPPEERAAHSLAAKVNLDGFRKVDQNQKAENTILYFVGPSDVDLTRATLVAGWSPQPAPADNRDADAFHWLTYSKGEVDGRQCAVTLSKLLPGFESVAFELSERERRHVADGTLAYVRVTCICA